jgi:voltage-gated potassium channel Kch
MRTITCHFAITVTVTGTPSAAALDRLGEVVEKAVAGRLRLARARLVEAGYTDIVPAEAADRRTAEP